MWSMRLTCTPEIVKLVVRLGFDDGMLSCGYLCGNANAVASHPALITAYY